MRDFEDIETVSFVQVGVFEYQKSQNIVDKIYIRFLAYAASCLKKRAAELSE